MVVAILLTAIGFLDLKTSFDTTNPAPFKVESITLDALNSTVNIKNNTPANPKVFSMICICTMSGFIVVSGEIVNTLPDIIANPVIIKSNNRLAPQYVFTALFLSPKLKAF